MVVLIGGFKTCGAEPAATSGRCLKRRYLLEGRLNHGHTELGDAHPRFYVKGRCASVPARDHEFALIIGVNQANKVAQHNAVFMAEANLGKIMAAVAGSLRWIASPLGSRSFVLAQGGRAHQGRLRDPVLQSLVFHNSGARLRRISSA